MCAYEDQSPVPQTVASECVRGGEELFNFR